MITALEEARAGAREGGIPVRAVLVNAQGTVVATGRNRRVQEGACVMHAGINSLLNADSGGFPDHVFAVTSLLDYRFIPRIRDLQSKRLHVFEPGRIPQPLIGLTGNQAKRT